MLLKDKISSYIHSVLNAYELGDITSEDVAYLMDGVAAAESLEMALRTFYRKLEGEKITYRAILDSIKADRAKYYLSETNRTFDAIGRGLGYTHRTGFLKFCKTKFNLTPTAYRARFSKVINPH